MKEEKINKELNHIPVLNKGVEYDGCGNVCGEWAEEVCERCGAVLGFMNSPTTCNEMMGK